MMNHMVYYFTGTGNSLLIAKELALLTKAKLLPVTATVGDATVSAEVIGVVFPIYMYNAPHIVYEFIQKIERCDYFYIVMTMGGESGNTSRKITTKIASRGFHLKAAFSLVMPSNYIPWNGAIPDEKQDATTNDARMRLPEIAAIVNDRREHRDDERNIIVNHNYPVPFLFRYPPLGVRQYFADMGFNFIRKMDGAFMTNEKCNGCGTCVRICPVHNVTLSHERPVWHHRCEQCFGCLQWCPREAVEYGRKSRSRRRYHHREIPVSDMVAQAEGR